MTQEERFNQLKEKEQKILMQIKKVRPIVLKRFLLYCASGKLHGIKSRRAKHDYVLAYNLMEQISDLLNDAVTLYLTNDGVTDEDKRRILNP